MSVEIIIHPTATALASFLSGDLSPREAGKVADHLLSQCSRCESKISELSLAALPSDQDALLSLASDFESYEATSVQVAPTAQLCEELLSLSDSRRQLLIANTSRFLTPAVCLELIELAWSVRFNDVHEMTSIMEIACSVAKHLVAADPGDKFHHDVHSRCLCYLANAVRSQSNLLRAARLFAEAERELALGTGDPVEKAHFWFLRTSLLLAQGELESAFFDAERSYSAFVEHGEVHLAGMALANGAAVAIDLDRLDLATEHLLQSMEMIEETRERTTFVAVRQNLAVVLFERGMYSEALETLREVKALYRPDEDRVPLLRAKQFEANIALAMGHQALAEKCLLEARNGFVCAGMGAPAAEMSLELASLYLAQKRHEEVRSIAEAVVPVFQCCDLHREVLAALLLFRESVLRESVTAAAVNGILEFLQVHQVDQHAQLATFLPS